MKKKLCFLICFLFIVLAFLSAQTAAEIEELLKTETLSYGQAARFVLKTVDISNIKNPAGFLSPEGALRFAMERKWLPKNAASGGGARLEGVSLLLMSSFNLKGGFLYSLFKSPHYAYREMVYQEIIQGRADPDMAVSGETLLFLINRILSRFEDDAIFANETVSEEEMERREQERVIAEQTAAARRTAEQVALANEINTQLEAQAVQNTSARVTEEGVTISLSNIQFLANSAELAETEKGKLREIAQILQSISKRRVLVSGHTALAGTVQDQLKTSLERAQSVASYLVFLGARRPDEIFVQGYGSERPVADNETPQGMALNRRVEITILEDQ